MRAVVDAKAFSEALSNVGKVPRQAAITVLAGVLIRIENGCCSITGTDLAAWLTVTLPAGGENFAFLLDNPLEASKACRYFNEELTLELHDQNPERLSVTLSCGHRCPTRRCWTSSAHCERRAIPMSGTTAAGRPDEPRYYAMEQLREAQKRLLDLSQSLVVWRARVEKYRNTDLTAAKNTFDVLLGVRRELAETLGEIQLLLMEAEEYQTAATAGKLRDGLLGFNLRSSNYGPVYTALRSFAESLPVEGTTNASIVGRLMSNIKLGYYPTDPDNIALMLRGIQFPEGVTTNVFDPCCGCGKALRQIAQGNNCYAYGVELDESRAEEAQTKLHRVGFGSFFYSRISREAFHLLFLNPPYLSVLNENGGKSRHEKRFLIESIPNLAYGGLLIYVIPYYRLTPDICRILTDNFDDLTVWRFTDAEFKQFKQVVVFGIRKRRNTEPQDTLWLERYAENPASIPSLYCPIRQANPYRRMAKAIRTNTVADNLLNREFEQHGPRKVLLTDITYIPYHGVFCYLSTILDAYTKQVLAYVLSPSLELDFVLETVNILVREHSVSLDSQTLIHSDQGCHYTSLRFIQILKDSSLRRSMSRRGNCWDNAPQESFFGHMKDEIDLPDCETFDQVKAIIDDWIDYYNNDRYQWQLAKLSPNEFYRYFVSGVYPLLGKPSFDANPDSI